MTFTSDERREVAARLRQASHTDADLDVTIAIAILETIGEVHRPIAAVVADLIDPTCHLVGTTSEEGLYVTITLNEYRELVTAKAKADQLKNDMENWQLRQEVERLKAQIVKLASGEDSEE